MKLVSILVGIAFLLLTPCLPAHAAPETKGITQQKTVEQILGEIQQSQGVNSAQQIDCNKVTNEQFEDLGDAFMRVMHPDTQQREFMKRMMGGEGSTSLSLVHRNMGARYLGCLGYGTDYGYTGMMSGGMMGGYGMAGNGMMGGYGTMSRGMMGGYGPPGGQGYRSPLAGSTKVVNESQAEALVKNHLDTLRNPNLRVGQVSDIGSAFEVDVVTQDGSLVDKIDVDKNTGYMNSIY